MSFVDQEVNKFGLFPFVIFPSLDRLGTVLELDDCKNFQTMQHLGRYHGRRKVYWEDPSRERAARNRILHGLHQPSRDVRLTFVLGLDRPLISFLFISVLNVLCVVGLANFVHFPRSGP